MPNDCNLPFEKIDAMRRTPIHSVLTELGTVGVEFNNHKTIEFQKLIAYVLEWADGRDRRDPWTQKPGIARPIPKLRVVVDEAFKEYGELLWFKLNRTANQSGKPLYGLFPRMAAAVARVDLDEFGEIIEALVSDSPDAALLRRLHSHGGRIKGMGLELFSRLAFAFRRDLYFVLPSPWVEKSGLLKYIDNDLRKYCAVCRSLRGICDQVNITEAIRGSVLRELLSKPKIDEDLAKALDHALGTTLLKYTLLESNDAYEPDSFDDDLSAMPLEFASHAIRARRGEKRLRNQLRQSYGNRCGISGPCPCDLLEIAYIVPYPQGNVHSMANAILLRSDLHTLWDLNLLGIDPEDLKVRVSEQLKGSGYEKLDGRTIVAPKDGTVVSSSSLRERWKLFKGDRPSKTRKKAAATIKSDQRRRVQVDAFPNRETSPEPSSQESQFGIKAPN
ncbi:MAG: HNH endonuclease signature motif containing protein [Planctomycetota bacterium]|nr:HNH endonuclease signature motif containing protein [Planctomycetota bacterium]